jgi:hypothetical protein
MHRVLLAAFLLCGALPAAAPTPPVLPPAPFAYDTVVVSKTKTSIYVGSVTLTMTPFTRGTGGIYTADYKATVVPFIIFSESGHLRITFTGEQLARLERGERVEFSGDGKNKGGSPRPITGHAIPDAPGAKTGKIKVRVFVTKKTALVFDTTYAFVDTPGKQTSPE